ncbi:MAG TPA: nucleotidyltransferase family protein [Terracidiphilus sp.]|nr:nucleotidyltransferase family protein [Terracidiphilus sp.]
MRPLEQNAADLLRAICTSRRGTSASAFAPVANRITAWDQVLEQARRHGVLPLLYLKLAEVAECVPASALAQARNDFERNAFHCMTNTEELLHVLAAFREADIPAMPFKGVVLAAAAYGDMTARAAGDLDLLIHYADLQHATAILKSRGYELRTKTLADGSPEAENYFEFHFERPADGMILELRWKLELTQPRYGYDLGLDWMWASRRSVMLAGAEVPDLDPVRSLLVLCMHGSKHAWSRWMWICDVAKLIESEPVLDWTFAQGEAKRVGLERCLALGVLLACRGAGADVPKDVLRDLEADRAMSRLADSLLRNLLERSGAPPKGVVPYHLQILGSRDRARAFFSPSILRPNERDRAAVKLPRFLDAVYYVIRPFRILLNRSSR